MHHESPQFRAVVGLALTMILAVFSCLWWLQDMPIATALQQAPLLGISAQSTAGFSTLDVQELHGATKLVLMFAMFVGGGLGSSAGGIKVWRLLVIWRLFLLLIVRTGSPPHAVLEPSLGRHRLESTEINEASLIVGLFFTVIFLSWIPFVVRSVFDVSSQRSRIRNLNPFVPNSDSKMSSFRCERSAVTWPMCHVASISSNYQLPSKARHGSSPLFCMRTQRIMYPTYNCRTRPRQFVCTARTVFHC